MMIIFVFYYEISIQKKFVKNLKRDVREAKIWFS